MNQWCTNWADIDSKGDIELSVPTHIAKYLTIDNEHVLGTAIPLREVMRQGVYFLVDGETIEYVGQSVNLYGRLYTHEKLKKYHKIAFLPVKEKNILKWVEQYYITKFNPVLNIKGKSLLKEV